MPATLASLGIDNLSDEDLGAIRDEIDAKLCGDTASHLCPELVAELERRLADAEANPEGGYSLEEAMAYATRGG